MNYILDDAHLYKEASPKETQITIIIDNGELILVDIST